jgi:anti-sigma B factor antagonist
MDLMIERVQDVVVAEVPYEELDASNATDFKRDVAALVASERKLVFDLTRLRFIDSSGLGAFLSCLRKVNERGGELKLCGLSKIVRAVFELVRMHRIFDIHPTRDAAVRAFAPTAATSAPSLPT